MISPHAAPSPQDSPHTVTGHDRRTAWAWTIGTFFGAGQLKPGPGTWGSVAAVLLWRLANGTQTWTRLGFHPGAPETAAHWRVAATILAALGAASLGVPAATRVARESAREDPGFVVIDEVAGQWTALIVCRPDWPHALTAFALFRLFDITKPWPARQLEALPGGWGIMLDDLAAGLYALLVLVLIQHWW